jgi:hypothetical protein
VTEVRLIVNSHINEPPFQGARGIHDDSIPKRWSSKAFIKMYRNHKLSCGVGLTSKDSWSININLWQKLREKRAAKRELMPFRNSRLRSLTNMAIASGACGIKSLVSPELTMLGVKQGSTSPVIHSRLGTLGTFVPARFFGEMEDKIGRKLMLGVMPEIGNFYVANPKGCQFLMTLLEMELRETYP